MKSTIAHLTAVFLLTVSLSYGQTKAEFFSKADTFFKTYIKQGRVAYSTIKQDPGALDELISMAEGISVSKSDSKEYQAFWINGYNLSVIKGIVDNYPIKSPLDKAGFFDAIKYNIGGHSITLNDIENKLLRANFPNEARFHFVLVCAGLGCPPIIDRAYLPSSLEVQLQKQTQLALNNPEFIKLNKNKVGLSQIFEWYKGDFTQGGKSLVDFVNLYRNEKLPEKAKTYFYSYDWTLNESK
ncbi:DUF547 domain-containing protein [Flavobacteriaceae bacterium 3-367]|uniref:DUF547 domain-containing protein n=1 Tax=Eudoraea algarum TaxID=3417568 RepID=UPI003269A8A8